MVRAPTRTRHGTLYMYARLAPATDRYLTQHPLRLAHQLHSHCSRPSLPSHRRRSLVISPLVAHNNKHPVAPFLGSQRQQHNHRHRRTLSLCVVCLSLSLSPHERRPSQLTSWLQLVTGCTAHTDVLARDEKSHTYTHLHTLQPRVCQRF